MERDRRSIYIGIPRNLASATPLSATLVEWYECLNGGMAKKHVLGMLCVQPS